MAMLPILLVVSLVAPHAWEGQSTPPASTNPTVVVKQATPVVEQVKPVVEQAKPVAPSPAQVRARRRIAERVPLKVAVPVETPDLKRTLEPVVARRQPLRIVVPSPNRTLTRQIERPTGAQAAMVEKRQTVEARQRDVAAQKELAQRRLELEHRMKSMQAAAESTLLEARLRQEEVALARQRELFEKGLATRETVAAAEGRLVETRQQIEMAKMNRAFAQEELAIRLQELELERRFLSERRAVEVHRELPMLDAAVALQPLDQLTIAIAGEPDLPTTFAVRADGSIRFPFLGSIRVQGSTTGQVQAVIQKLLSDKGLAQSQAVTVSARRGR